MRADLLDCAAAALVLVGLALTLAGVIVGHDGVAGTGAVLGGVGGGLLALVGMRRPS